MSRVSIKNHLAESGGKVAKNAAAPTLKDLIERMKPEIEKALPSVITPERFTRIVLSTVSKNPALGSCEPRSFLAAMMTSAQLGLEPNTPLGHAYLIPYRDNRRNVTECQFQLGYKGMLDLAYRTGEYAEIYAEAVYPNDHFVYTKGLHRDIQHEPGEHDPNAEPTHYYAVWKLINGGYGFAVMTRDEVLSHAKKTSKSFKSGPWQTYFDAMAKKTVLKEALKYAPMKTDVARQITADETVKTSISDDMIDVPSEYVEAGWEVDDDPETGVETVPTEPIETVPEASEKDYQAGLETDPKTGEAIPGITEK
jgi:recombination protein RecT